jgi:sn-glycerol 3-phosphate transport system substrate-binding protein
VLKGKSPAENKGTAQFLKFISDTPQQMWWHVNHRLPRHLELRGRNLEAGYPLRPQPDQFTRSPSSPACSPRRRAWIGKKPAPAKSAHRDPNSQGIRLGNFVQIRDVIEAELENIFAGKKTTKQGLDDAVAKSNQLLKEFAAANKP